MLFDGERYLTDMKSLIDESITKLKAERPRFKVFSVSIWTDANAGVSSINLDSRANSHKHITKWNKYNQKKYREFVKEGDLEMAALFNQQIDRNVSPADFLLRNFIVKRHLKFPKHWEEKSNGQCWKILRPALTKVGNYAFKKMQALPLETDFELAVNSQRDWYDKTWKSK
jgi:hypothetical protein